MKSVEHYLGLNYRTTVYRDDEGDFIVKVPELPGCIADGKTPNEAFENLRSAMRSWVESRMKAGLDIPEPRSTEDFSGRVLLRMPRYLHERLSHQAETEGISLNQYMVSLLSEASSPMQTQQNLFASGANAYSYLGITGMVYQGLPFANPNGIVVRAHSSGYVCYPNDYRFVEGSQQNLIVRNVLSNVHLGQENEKGPVLRPQIVPKQQVA